MARPSVTAVDDRTTIDPTGDDLRRSATSDDSNVMALVVAWSREEPQRIGEVALITGEQVLGRGGSRPEDGAARVRFHRQRPGSLESTGPIQSLRISRVQLRLAPLDDGIALESVGRSPLRIDGAASVTSGEVCVGGTVLLGDDLLLCAVRRPQAMPPLASYPAKRVAAFGAPDAHGFVGESVAAWRLREATAFAARADGHVLVRGESGVGKELIARAVHELSPRSAGPLVSRNAATFPATLVDAELFGSARDYPNAGAAERPGLIGEAQGGTLLLDEIGELPQALQAHLLRVLDRGGEYQRLGEARVRRADVRVVAATNRPLDALKQDFAARFSLRIDVHPLSERREDVALLLRHVLERAVSTHPDVARAVAPKGVVDLTRVDPRLVDGLVRHRYRHHTRELEELVWRALGERHPDGVRLTPALSKELDPETRSAAGRGEPSRAEIEASLGRHAGNVTRAARELGVKSRYALYRLMRKLGVPSPG